MKLRDYLVKLSALGTLCCAVGMAGGCSSEDDSTGAGGTTGGTTSKGGTGGKGGSTSTGGSSGSGATSGLDCSVAGAVDQCKQRAVGQTCAEISDCACEQC